jgi:hypothetical protein
MSEAVVLRCLTQSLKQFLLLSLFYYKSIELHLSVRLADRQIGRLANFQTCKQAGQLQLESGEDVRLKNHVRCSCSKLFDSVAKTVLLLSLL